MGLSAPIATIVVLFDLVNTELYGEVTQCDLVLLAA